MMAQVGHVAQQLMHLYERKTLYHLQLSKKFAPPMTANDLEEKSLKQNRM